MSYEKHDIINLKSGIVTLEGEDFSGQPVKLVFDFKEYGLGAFTLHESSDDVIISSGAGPFRVAAQEPVRTLEINLNYHTQTDLVVNAKED